MKSIFAIIAVEDPTHLSAAITKIYPNDHLELGTSEWLVADEGTTQTVYERVTGQPAKAKEASPIGGFMVLSIASYWGSKPANVWEWIRAKWGGQSV